MILLGVVVLFWGLSWYAIALQIGDTHPVVSIAWRFGIAGIVLCAWLKLRSEFQAPTRSQLPLLCALSVCLFCANFISFYFAASYITSGLISIVFAAAVFITVFNQWVWAGIKPMPRTLLGAAFGVTGIATLFAPSLFSTVAADQYNTMIGLSLSVLGTWFFSVGNLVSAALSKQAHTPSMIGSGMLIGATICTAAALVLGESMALPMDATYLAALVYLAIGASVIAFVAYLTLVAQAGAAQAGYATVLFPIVALAVSTLLEGYQWSLPSVLGVVLASMGAFIVFYRSPATGSSHGEA
ncbi:MAG: DMT family transporter [Granulosicoccaceae bacterium]